MPDLAFAKVVAKGNFFIRKYYFDEESYIVVSFQEIYMDLHFKAALESNFLHKKNERISRNFFNRYSNILFMKLSIPYNNFEMFF